MLIEHQPAGAVGRGQIDGHAAAERFAHLDDLAFADPRPLGEPGTGGAGIGQDARLVRRAFAAAVAAIVVDHHGGAEAVQLAENVGPMAQIAAVAVREQDHRPRAVARHEPPVQPRAVGGAKLRVFKRQIGRLPVAVRIARGKEDQRPLEEHHEDNDTEVDESRNADDAEPERAAEHAHYRNRAAVADCRSRLPDGT